MAGNPDVVPLNEEDLAPEPLLPADADHFPDQVLPHLVVRVGLAGENEVDRPGGMVQDPVQARGAPAPVNDVPMDRWRPDEVEAHIGFMNDFAARLERSGEFIDGQALSPDGVWVRYDGEGRPPVTDGPFAETKDLIAGWMVIDVDSYERAIELAGELSAAPGAGGEPIHEWLEVRPFLAAPPTVTQ